MDKTNDCTKDERQKVTLEQAIHDLTADLCISDGGWRKDATKGLIAGIRENGKRVVTYTFDATDTKLDHSDKVNNINRLDADQRKAVAISLEEIEKVCNLKFRLVGHKDLVDKADIKIFQANVTSKPKSFTKGRVGGYTGASKTGEVDIIISSHFAKNEYEPRSLGAITISHEFLHALGLSHPGSDGKDGGRGGDNPLYTKQDTIMSYNRIPDMKPPTLAPLDIAVLQYLYGSPIRDSDDINKGNAAPRAPTIPSQKQPTNSR